MLVVTLNNGLKFRLLYSAENFISDRTVTGYLIYPDLEKSDIFTFDPLGDGVYTVELLRGKKSDANMDKWGLVLKEDGIVKKFTIIQMLY